MTNVIEWSKRLTDSELGTKGVATLDGVAKFASPYEFAPGRIAKVQVCSIQISDRVPNIYDATPYYEFNNTLLRVWTNVTVGFPTTIQLPRGLYSSTTQIADAINAAIAADPIGALWQTNSNDPVLSIDANPITDQVIVTLDGSKLAFGFTSISFDFRKTTTNTDLSYTLGFVSSSALFVTTGPLVRFASTLTPRLDTQGTSIDVRSSIVAPRRRNSEMVTSIATISYAGKSTISDNLWPASGQISSIMPYTGTLQLSAVYFAFRTSEDNPMLFMGGGVSIVIEFKY